MQFGLVSNSYVSGNVEGTKYVGGLVGFNDTAEITLSYSTGTVTGTDSVGGLVGFNKSSEGEGYINNSYSSGKVIGSTDANAVGGLVGLNDGEIENSYSSGDVEGYDLVGGLVGVNESNGIINSSYSSGKVIGSNEGVGGLVGLNIGEIENSYSSGDTTGNGGIGGLVGANQDGTIENSYTSSKVTGDYFTGGLVGFNTSPIVNSFYDKTINENMPDESFFGKTTIELQTPSTFSNWDNEVWSFQIDGAGNSIEGYEIAKTTYPFLSSVTRDIDKPTNGISTTLFAGGFGTSNDAYEITNWTQLQNINNSNILTQNYYFNLINDLDSATNDYTILASETANDGEGWKAIGAIIYPSNAAPINSAFTGNFDGLGHTIDKLIINRPLEHRQGLFGYTDGANISNIEITDVNVIGYNSVGGLVGYSFSTTITNSYAMGDVSGKNSVGGLSGDFTGSMISSYTKVNISGKNSVGGLSGEFDGSMISSYATGTVSGEEDVGGLVGLNDGGEIGNSYATGTVSGEEDVGGLVGELYDGNITNSYATGKVSGEENTGGLVGYHWYDANILNSYSSGDVSGNNQVGGLVGYLEEGEIINSYASGSITGNENIGGLIGDDHNGDISNSFYDKTINENMPDESSYGKTTAELQNITTFTTNIAEASERWDIELDTTQKKIYPYLTFDTNGSAIWKVGIYPTAINYILGTKNTTYNGKDQDLTDFWSNSIFGDDGSSFVAGTDYKFVYNSNDTTSFKNTGTYADISVVLLNSAYEFDTSKTNTLGSLTITPKAITVSADDLTKVYGSTDEALTYKATGLLGEDTLAGSLKREVGEDVADYAISQGTLTNSNYKVTFTDGKYTITPKAITVSADDLTKVYGSTDEALTYTASGLVGTDTLAGSLKRVAGEDAGNYTISENAALTNSNYKVTFTDGKYTITPKAITVSADDLTKVYGQEDETLTYTATGLLGEDTLVGSLKRAAGENAGDYTISENTALTNSNYTVTFTDGKYTITPKAITVSADDLSKVYGQEDAALTYSTNGLVGEDTLVGSLKRAAGENAGDYTISENVALTNSNYTVTFENGKYTITPKAITVSADDLTKVYGQEDAALTYTANGLETGDTLVGSLKRAEGEDAGEYTISQGTLANSNYTVSFTDGKYTITPKAITVSADDLTKVYGDEDEVLTYTANGLVGQDTLAGILQRVEGEDAGDYEISQGNLANSNYVISFENGIYTITPATNSNIDNIIATIIKTNVKVPTAPVKVVVNNNPNIVSQPEAEEVATQIVTLSEIKTNQENSQTNEGSQTQQDVRVPISKNSVIELVNGGVNLPEGVDQQFFVANTDSQEN